MNELCTPNGQQLFNVQAFPLNSVKGYWGQVVMCDDALTWVRGAWFTAQGGLPIPFKYQFGCMSAHSNSKAHANFKQIYEFRKGWLPAMAYETCLEVWGDDSPLCEFPAPAAESEEAADCDFTEEESRYAAESAAGRVGADSTVGRPDWASLSFDVDKWWHLLEKHEVDQLARENLFMLAQFGEAGRFEALDLLVKLQHKSHKGELSNPGNWLHNAASKARQRLCERAGMWGHWQQSTPRISDASSRGRSRSPHHRSHKSALLRR